MREIKNIELIFENCEVILLERENIGWFTISGIQKEIRRTALNSIDEVLYANTVFIQIMKDFKYDSYGEIREVFKRITDYHDIVCVSVNFNDGASEEYYVDYEDEIEGLLGTSNVNQKEMMSNGQLAILISKDGKMEDFITKEELDEEPIDFL